MSVNAALTFSSKMRMEEHQKEHIKGDGSAFLAVHVMPRS